MTQVSLKYNKVTQWTSTTFISNTWNLFSTQHRTIKVKYIPKHCVLKLCISCKWNFALFCTNQIWKSRLFIFKYNIITYACYAKSNDKSECFRLGTKYYVICTNHKCVWNDNLRLFTTNMKNLMCENLWNCTTMYMWNEINLWIKLKHNVGNYTCAHST